MIVYEVVHPLRSARLSEKRKMAILDYIDLPVAETGKRILQKELISSAEKKKYKLLFNAG